MEKKHHTAFVTATVEETSALALEPMDRQAHKYWLLLMMWLLPTLVYSNICPLYIPFLAAPFLLKPHISRTKIIEKNRAAQQDVENRDAEGV